MFFVNFSAKVVKKCVSLQVRMKKILLTTIFLSSILVALADDVSTNNERPNAQRRTISSSNTEMAQSAISPQSSDAPTSDATQNLGGKKANKEVTSTAWTMIPPLGLHQKADVDTSYHGYYYRFIPSVRSLAYATTGNYGASGMNMIYFERKPMSDFFFRDALREWIPDETTHKFYNTGRPMTEVAYNTGGGRQNVQDRFYTIFSGNIDKRSQVGGMVDYIYSKGSYNYQATKNLTWGLSGSHMGDRYEVQAFYYHYNLLQKENGGITDDRYITDPADIQGGKAGIDAKTIPTVLTASHSKIVGQQFLMNHRYKVGYYHEEQVNDTTVRRTYIPVSSFIWTFDFKHAKHIFLNSAPGEEKYISDEIYLNNAGTDDRSSYYTLSNTLGVSLLEGFNKYAKFGLAAYAKHQLRNYKQTVDTIYQMAVLPEGLTPHDHDLIADKATENLLWVGGQLTKQRGSILRYAATAEFGVAGPVAGDIDVTGNIETRIPLFGDSVAVRGFGFFKNQAPPYLLNNYRSNHFIWKNDFGKTRRVRFGGSIFVPQSKTNIEVGVENVQNLIYFGSDCLPVQAGGSVQIFNATLRQNFRFGILRFDNRLTYQTSTNEAVLSLPKFSFYSALYLNFKVARVLDVDLGVDCDYYTKYKAPKYQPATMSFCNQDEMEIGNYPLMNVYANMNLKQARFYIMFSHVNQGWPSKNYFSMPHYPINPRKFQMGVSVNFKN